MTSWEPPTRPTCSANGAVTLPAKPRGVCDATEREQNNIQTWKKKKDLAFF